LLVESLFLYLIDEKMSITNFIATIVSSMSWADHTQACYPLPSSFISLYFASIMTPSFIIVLIQ